MCTEHYTISNFLQLCSESKKIPQFKLMQEDKAAFLKPQQNEDIFIHYFITILATRMNLSW